MPIPIDTRFEPKSAEPRLYAFWEERDLFRANPKSGKRPFVIALPPPNVTGSLHMGHALNDSIQDCLIRFHRLRGFEALWIPGTDHAGIATQNVVEKELRKEKKNRFELGREKFLERVWAWKEQYGNTIVGQMKRLGCSCDWSRLRFTMDEGYSRAVREVFVRWYEAGLVYKGKRIVNWCPRCLTALSDIEVEHRTDASHLWHIRYPIEGDPSKSITVATTRPETMLGDTGVAVHPDDARYRSLVGKNVVLPLLGRRIPIVADTIVDREFGTGAVKVTPAHDANDYDIAQRAKLPALVVMDEKGVMNDEAGPFRGLERFAARQAVVKALEEQGFLVKTDDYAVSVGTCYRCQTVIEPYLSEQWFVKMKPLSEPTAAATRDGRVRFFPERWAKVYLDWLDNTRDWCISRQIWWGHRVPVWNCAACSERIVSRTTPTQCTKCGKSELVQEEHVLDTWFSSALWPFATLGWPDDTEDLRAFYPTSTLTTDRGIIYLWVARMVMTGLHFMRHEPYAHVVIHPTVQNAQGQRMSKSLGTGIDPLDLIEKHGADATRFGLLAQVTGAQDIRFQNERIEMGQRFATKLWNATRFLLDKLEPGAGLPALPKPGDPRLKLEDRWILSRLTSSVRDTTRLIEGYEFGPAANGLYDFVWSDFCDWYIELSKGRLAGTDAASAETAKAVLVHVLDASLRLLHPIMPFVTEALWQELRKAERAGSPRAESLLGAKWPEADAAREDGEATRVLSLLIETVRGIREVKARYNLGRSKVRARVRTNDVDGARILRDHATIVESTAGATLEEIGPDVAKPPFKATSVTAGGEVYVLLEGLVDREKELARMRAQLEKSKGFLATVRAKIDSPTFRAKADPEIVAREEDRARDLGDQIRALEEAIRELGG
ncbi:MAG: valine--tRNA ligase [Planctomycetes bacterium]|nr:valine--tRNA ligase [Planctomycetota bacterium]